MIEVVREIPVRRPAGEVLEYLADFAHAVEWDPGTVECVRVGAGGVVPGARWRNVSVFRGRRTELVYELAARESDRLVFVGRNRTVTARDEITVGPAPGGTVVRYRARLRFHGLARLAGPFVRGEFERLADAAARRMPEVLDGG
ncbi:SRPBCC family protein [Kitasatospora phosalacinea]|uniref:SRPBCC family protein n=1 Tax=Kitasatospora phosalacinea TaxID=2065 RepID=UPI00052709DE|nr:SRPBCC family protein [Kitasatospora phosalacinea]